MSDLSTGLQALASRADIAGRAERMDQFRADFKAVWRWYRDAGELSPAEYAEQYAEATEFVKSSLSNAELISCVMNGYRTKALEIARDRARSERIAAEVRAQREAEKRKRRAT